MKVLAGDIGGTKTLLQLVEVSGSQLRVEAEARYESAGYGSFDDLLENFITAQPGLLQHTRSVCLAIAGPVHDVIGGQRVETTNLPWHLDSTQLSRRFDLPRLRLVNDFYAVGRGIAGLTPADLRTIQSGEPRAHAPGLVLGAGTGLGVAQLIWQDEGYQVVSSEAGHMSFAPASDEHLALLRYLGKEHGRVSWERVVSGPGLVNIYAYLCDQREGQGSPSLAQLRSAADPAAKIFELARERRDQLAEQAMQWFVLLYGAVAGDLALVNLPYGGVYLAGGIAPKVLDQVSASLFISAFTKKGRMSALNQSFPVHIILHPSVGLLGAALIASRL